MRKKLLSGLLAGAMIIASMPMLVLADETREPGIYVGDTKYDSIAAAQSAAGANGTITISGTVEFGYRQGISVDGITLEGENDAKIVPSESYGSNTSDTNKKGLLNFSGDNIIVNNITFDGSAYGDTITASTSPDFIVVRVNEGSTTFNNVSITGSPRTLLSVGTSTTSATLTANNLSCQAEYKEIDLANSYADVNVVNGTFNLNSGHVNGFICEDSGWSGLTRYEGTFNNNTGNHFKLDHYEWIFVANSLTSTVEHYVNSYINAKASSDAAAEAYADDISNPNNLDVVGDMVDYAIEKGDTALNNNFIILLEEAADVATTSDAKTTIEGYIAELGGTQA